MEESEICMVNIGVRRTKAYLPPNQETCLMIEDNSASRIVSFKTRKKKVRTLLKGLKYRKIVNKYVTRLLTKEKDRNIENNTQNPGEK